MSIDFTDVEVGLEVNDLRFGNGTIIWLDPRREGMFPIVAQFLDGVKQFTANGRHSYYQSPTLRIGHFEPMEQGDITVKIDTDTDRMLYWQDVYRNDALLSESMKTKEEALLLANYYEGRVDALVDIRDNLVEHDANVIESMASDMYDYDIHNDHDAFNACKQVAKNMRDL